MKGRMNIYKERLEKNMKKYVNDIKTGPFWAPKNWGDIFQTLWYLLNYDSYGYEAGSISEKKIFGMIILLLTSTLPYLSSRSDIMLVLGKKGQFSAIDRP